MTIRVKLTVVFTLMVVAILLLFCGSIYYFSSKTRENSFYMRLKNRSTNTARHLVDTQGITGDLLKTLDKNISTVSSHSNVSIYNQSNLNLYTSNEAEAISNPSANLLNEIRAKGELRFRDGEKEALGIVYKGKVDQVVVIASAVDEIGLKNMFDLKLILVSGLIISIVITVFAGYLFSGQTLNPITNVIKQVGKINSKSLQLRINEGNGTDEIAQLAIEFNKMIEKLEAAFDMQRSFVSNASHEFRTPLTSIGGQIDIALMNELETPEYKAILCSIREDVNNMNQLSNGLFELAQTSFDASILKLGNTRIDELILQSRDDLNKKHKDYSIHIEYSSFPEDEKKLTVIGNDHLLKTAIINVMDNACKYSPDKSVSVKITSDEKKGNIAMEFIDKGIGIAAQDMARVFEPFFRAGNSHEFSGHGIGLSLVEKIIDLHKGFIKLNSELGKGTTVWITLPAGTT